MAITAQGFPTTEAPLPHRQGRTLGDGLATSDNALNLIRLVLALSVIVAHTPAISGIPFENRLMDRLGDWAVNGFFIISGYLIVASRLRSSWYTYLIRRAARIYPAFWAQLVVVAFVLAPIVAALGAGTWHLRSAVEHVARNVTLFNGLELLPLGPYAQIPGIQLPVMDVWNGSTWTLMYELLAYLACLLVFSIPWCRRRITATALVAITGFLVFNYGVRAVTDVDNDLYNNAGRLGLFFMTGVLAYSLRNRIPARWSLWAVSIALCAALYVIPEGMGAGLAFLPLAYATLAGGVLLPWRLGAHNDISYGVYVYAFPIQQVMTVAGVQEAGWGAHLIASMALTILVALASWHLVEKPGMAGGKRLIGAIRRSPRSRTGA